ncbi:unnamed protein product [Spirodela intermedia]|uniref:Uncharacterized protein n=1 Tax=Spirodela intermedia TaxID=51605 RepID=A0A7I8I7N5_SPIIN|nr:unnamed protein product [Spirodela intermedia]CAA6653549.1 unnamed protein product [Spirodela intermedia]
MTAAVATVGAGSSSFAQTAVFPHPAACRARVCRILGPPAGGRRIGGAGLLPKDEASRYSMSVSMYRGGARGSGRPRTAPPDLPSLLLDARICYLGMPILPAVTELLVAQLMWLDYDNPSKPIYMYINSSGTQSWFDFLEITNHKVNLIKLLAKGIGKPKEEIAKDIQRPKYFQAQEAIAYGIADKTIDSRDAAFEKRLSTSNEKEKEASRRGNARSCKERRLSK